MWLLSNVNATVHHYPQTTYILVATLMTVVFAGWCCVAHKTVPPESRRIAALMMVWTHLFAYNLFLLLVSDPGQRVWACVFALVLVLCVVMMWPLPHEPRITTEEEDEVYWELP